MPNAIKNVTFNENHNTFSKNYFSKSDDQKRINDFVYNYLNSVGISVADARNSGTVNAWNQFDKWKDRHW